MYKIWLLYLQPVPLYIIMMLALWLATSVLFWQPSGLFGHKKSCREFSRNYFRLLVVTFHFIRATFQLCSIFVRVHSKLINKKQARQLSQITVAAMLVACTSNIPTVGRQMLSATLSPERLAKKVNRKIFRLVDFRRTWACAVDSVKPAYVYLPTPA